MDQVIGTGDGKAREFALIKTYRAGALSQIRRIHKPVENTVIVAINGTIDHHYELLTWKQGKNAGLSMEVKAFLPDNKITVREENNNPLADTANHQKNIFHLVQPMPYPINVGDLFSVYPGCAKTFDIGLTRIYKAITYGRTVSASTPYRFINTAKGKKLILVINKKLFLYIFTQSATP